MYKRQVYYFANCTHLTAGVQDAVNQYRFWSFDLDSHVYTKLPQPTFTVPSTIGECRLVWDNRNKAVIFPYTVSPDGVVKQMLVYDTTVATPAWVDYGLAKQGGTQVVRGNRSFYDPDQNVVILGGTAFGVSNLDAFFLWRYK